MNPIKELTLYSYFYSSASWRVRAVLLWKNIPYKYENIPLLENVQHSDQYTKINPLRQVPSLKIELDDGRTHHLTQSLAIIQYLDHYYPEPAIYPKDPILRAKCNAIADTISGGIQPLQNLETLIKYGEPLGKTDLTQEDRKKIARYWIDGKMKKLDELVAQTAGKYCVGDELSVADICLVPQMYNARDRFELDTSQYPTIKAIDERLREMEIFKKSHPYACPDAPKKS